MGLRKYLTLIAQRTQTILAYPYWTKCRSSLVLHYSTQLDKWFVVSYVFLLLFIIVLRTLDVIFWHNFLSEFYPRLAYLPILIALGIFFVSITEYFPRVSLVGVAFVIVFFTGLLQIVFLNSAIDTPFPVVDKWLLKVDVLLHFNVVAVMQWTFRHPFLHAILHFCYNTWAWQLIVLPFGLAFFRKKRLLIWYLIGFMWLFIIGCTIYFFFPTIGLSSLVKSPLFSHQDRLVAPFFYAIHHGGLPSVAQVSVVSLPSFHVIGSLWICFVVTFTVRGVRKKSNSWWRRMALSLFLSLVWLLNFLLISSTLLLGQHYVFDDIVSVVMVVAVYYATLFLFKDDVTTASIRA